jgi:uncharacterized protein YhfF
MGLRHMYLPAAATAPAPAAIDGFMAAAARSRRDIDAGADCQVRWIGFDADSTRRIFDLIRAGDKTGTFTLPWIVARTGQPEPATGRLIVLIDMSGRPTLLLRTTRVGSALFGQVTADDTRVDGSPVRDPAVWVPLHTQYWNDLLRPYGLAVSDDMPFWIEEFELLHDAGSP